MNAKRTSTALGLVFGLLACSCGWDPSRPFERNAPQVNQALEALDAGDAGAAAQLLESYLGTGECNAGALGLPDRAKEQKHASFDLGLALFHMAEQFGPRFGEEENTPDGGPTAEQKTQAQLRSDQADCAIKLLQAIATAPGLAVELAARARYLEGNLEFLRKNYHAAVSAYDEALKLVPGIEGDAGDGIGRDAAWNRAIALRRIEDENKRDAGQDASEDQDSGQDAPDEAEAGKDSGEDAPDEAGQDAGKDGGKDAGQDASDDGGQQPDGGGEDGGQDASSPPNQQPDGGQPPPQQNQSQDDRILDMLESAPTVQLQDAKNRAARRRASGMADK